MPTVFLFLLAFCCWTPVLAAAQTPTVEEVTLDDLIARVISNGPAARAVRSQLAVNDADVELAGVLPNPELSYSAYGRTAGNANAINGSQHQVWVEWPLKIGGQRAARVEAAEALAEAARAQADVKLLELEVAARHAFADLLLAQTRVAHLEEVMEALERLRTTVATRTAAGAQSRYDVVRIEIEQARAGVQLQAAVAQRLAASQVLASMVGEPGWQLRAAGELAVGDSPSRNLEHAPALTACRLAVRAAELDVSRSRAERVPDLTLGAGGYFTTDGGSTSLYGSVSIPLPVMDAGGAAVARAHAAREAMERTLEATAADLQARLQGTLEVLQARRRGVEQLEHELAARTRELGTIAEDAYRLGASPIFEVLDAFRARLDLELTRLDLLREAVGAEVELLAITGHPPR